MNKSNTLYTSKPTFQISWSLSYSLLVFLKEFFKKGDFDDKKKRAKLLRRQKVKKKPIHTCQAQSEQSSLGQAYMHRPA